MPPWGLVMLINSERKSFHKCKIHFSKRSMSEMISDSHKTLLFWNFTVVTQEHESNWQDSGRGLSGSVGTTHTSLEVCVGTTHTSLESWNPRPSNNVTRSLWSGSRSLWNLRNKVLYLRSGIFQNAVICVAYIHLQTDLLLCSSMLKVHVGNPGSWTRIECRRP